MLKEKQKLYDAEIRKQTMSDWQPAEGEQPVTPYNSQATNLHVWDYSAVQHEST